MGGAQLFDFPEGAHEERTSKLVELGTDHGMIGARGGALVEDPAGYRYISPDSRTAMSA